jgi:hypothetical protein
MKITKEDLAKSTELHRIYEGATGDGGDLDSAINDTEHTIWFTAVSDDNKGVRETWSGVRYVEEIDVDSINTDSFRIFIKDHEPSTDNVIGRVEKVEKADGKLKAQIRFSHTESAKDVFTKYREGVLTDVSIGYRYDLDKAEIIDMDDSDMPLVRLKEVEIFELSSVWAGFDKKAKIGRVENAIITDEEVEVPQSVGLSPNVVEMRLNLLSRRK